MVHEIGNRKKSLAMTTALFALLFLLFFLLKMSNTIMLPELEGGGGGGEVAVNFGDSDFGSGTNYQSLEKVVSAPKQTRQAAAAEKEIVVSENEDAPAIAEVKKPSEKPKKIEEKPVEKVVPKPAKSTSDALSNLLNGSNKSGDGDDKKAGNKGKAGGDANATGYNGGGGSGTGSGGGNGSGQGLGTGSGYGNGNGGGVGNGNGNYRLAGRKFLSKPQPQYTCNEQGTVVVQITVDKSGKVIGAQPGIRGTTNAAKCLLDQAKIAALNTVVNPSDDAPEKQVGTIIYNFKLTD